LPIFGRVKEELSLELLSNAKIVVVAGSKAPFSSNEVTLLNSYVETGGSVFVLAEANSQAHVYNALTQNYGIKVVKGNPSLPLLTY